MVLERVVLGHDRRVRLVGGQHADRWSTRPSTTARAGVGKWTPAARPSPNSCPSSWPTVSPNSSSRLVRTRGPTGSGLGYSDSVVASISEHRVRIGDEGRESRSS